MSYGIIYFLLLFGSLQIPLLSGFSSLPVSIIFLSLFSIVKRLQPQPKLNLYNLLYLSSILLVIIVRFFLCIILCI